VIRITIDRIEKNFHPFPCAVVNAPRKRGRKKDLSAHSSIDPMIAMTWGSFAKRSLPLPLDFKWPLTVR